MFFPALLARLRPLLLAGLLAVLAMLPLLAWGQDASSPPTATPGTMPAELQYLLGLGPYGALLAGAWILAGKGLKITIDVRLSDEERGLARRGLDALEELARRRRLDAA